MSNEEKSNQDDAEVVDTATNAEVNRFLQLWRLYKKVFDVVRYTHLETAVLAGDTTWSSDDITQLARELLAFKEKGKELLRLISNELQKYMPKEEELQIYLQWLSQNYELKLINGRWRLVKREVGGDMA